ncbi:MAG: formyltransferase family protein [Burkholderiales bacterium]
MNHRVCILLNSLSEYDFQELVDRYLPADSFDVSIADIFPIDPSQFDLIVPWSYRKILGQAKAAGNVVVFHSSDLPDGRGWAPIYYSFVEQKDEYVISGILAADEVDTGDIIVRARFPIEAGYTATFLRKIDEVLSLVLIAGVLQHWPDSSPTGVPQGGGGSFRSRRHASDNEIDITKPLAEFLPHLRGVEHNNPAFFVYEKIKYRIEIRPDFEPNRPQAVVIEYPAIGIIETWADWHDSP